MTVYKKRPTKEKTQIKFLKSHIVCVIPHEKLNNTIENNFKPLKRKKKKS